MLPHEIEQESFRLIRAELGMHHFSPEEEAIVVRMIHATGDFDFRDITRFHPQAITAGLEALRHGCTIVTDSLFWLVKQYCGATLNETFKYYTTATFIASVVALAGTFLLSFII